MAPRNQTRQNRKVLCEGGREGEREGVGARRRREMDEVREREEGVREEGKRRERGSDRRSCEGREMNRIYEG